VTVTNTGLFSQLLAQFPRGDFQRLVAKHQAERHAKGFSCFTQLTAMLFCQLARADSLREIEHGLRSCGGKIKHLGLAKVPPRSTLSYANAHRPPGLFRDFFFFMLDRLRSQSGFIPRRHRFSFKNPLLSLDATIVHLSLKLFPWADFNRVKGGIKVHVVLDHADYLPRYAHVSPVRQHDVQYARSLSLPQGSVVALDKGYLDLEMFRRWNAEGVYFVTPEKKWLSYRITLRQVVLPASAILSDQLIRFTGKASRVDYPEPLRRVELRVEDRRGARRRLVLLTNQLDLPAEVIAAIYQERWQIELFFKALKQNLALKNFVGSTQNALEIQIWTAMIAMLLLKWLHYLSECRWSLSNLAGTLRLHLFTHRGLIDFLNQPWDPPPEPEEPAQLCLGFGKLDSRMN
jgi:hypothetical protein